MSDGPALFAPEALWIGPAHPFDLHEAYLCFRSPDDWVLDSQPDLAEILISADSRYKLWVNGRFVGRGPARCYPEFQAVDRIELTSYLQQGLNLLAVQVYQPGYSHFAYVHRGAAGLLAEVKAGGQTILASGASWKMRRDPSFQELVPRVSIYSSGVEERDMVLAEPWTALDYNDADWEQARIAAPVGGYPWTALQERELPLLEEGPLPMTLTGMRRGFTSGGRGQDAHMALRAAWFSGADQPIPETEDGWYKVDLAVGESAVWLFDLGRDYTCLGWAEVESASGQEQLTVSYAEKMRGGELVLSDPQTYCRVRLSDRFHLRPGAQHVEPFAFRGGRYLLFHVAGPTGAGFRFQAHCFISTYPLEVDFPLQLADEELASIVQLCETTFQACLQDGFVDSTWRESSQWLGDALPQSLIMAAMTADTRPLRRVIEMAAQGAYADGILPGVMPGEVHAYTVVDYNFLWVELLRLYLELTDDQEFILHHWSVLSKMFGRFAQDLNEDGLLISQPGRRLFLDWASLSRQEPSAVYNLQYLYALQRAAALGGELDREKAEIDDYCDRANALQAACRRHFWRNGRWYDDLKGSTFSQLAAALALLTETAQVGEKEALLEAIIGRSLDPDDEAAAGKMVLASPFRHHDIFEALRKNGRDDAVVEIIRRRWGRWVKAGYPTTWENWQVDFPDGSQCHAFSAHPRYHLAEIFNAYPKVNT